MAKRKDTEFVFNPDIPQITPAPEPIAARPGVGPRTGVAGINGGANALPSVPQDTSGVGADNMKFYGGSYSYTPGGGPVDYEAPVLDPFRYGRENEYQAALTAAAHRQPFSYDVLSDPVYAAYQDQYRREGQRAMENTLAQLSSRTGGLASSYAGSAAAQANNYYMQQLSDKVPELYKDAYQRYAQDYSMDLQALDAMAGDRQRAYGEYTDRWNMLRADDETAYQRARDAQQAAREQMDWLAGYGDYSGLEGAGVDTSYLRAMQAAEMAKNDASSIWAYGNGEPYRISSAKGQSFVAGAAPGQTMVGDDGSLWTKNADGSVTITKNGQTWTIAGQPMAAGGGPNRGPYTPPDDFGGGNYIVPGTENPLPGQNLNNTEDGPQDIYSLAAFFASEGNTDFVNDPAALRRTQQMYAIPDELMPTFKDAVLTAEEIIKTDKPARKG